MYTPALGVLDADPVSVRSPISTALVRIGVDGVADNLEPELLNQKNLNKNKIK